MQNGFPQKKEQLPRECLEQVHHWDQLLQRRLLLLFILHLDGVQHLQALLY